ncbi:hypothetical protein MTR67_001138, partial [Solanum verrucosum]
MSGFHEIIYYIEVFLKTQCVPIIVGGSNSIIEKLVEDPVFMFKHKYDSCFIWIDVEQSVLNRRVDTRVDEMVNAGLVDEVRQIFISDVAYTKRIRRSIGVPEMAKYLREEKNIVGDDESKKMILHASISTIKRNTRTGKSCLSVDLATHFRGEIINSDKMQVYKGLEIVTNKITRAEKQGVQHYLLGEIEPDSNFTAEDFCLKSIDYIENFLKTQCVPIIVGGSNSFIEKLV